MRPSACTPPLVPSVSRPRAIGAGCGVVLVFALAACGGAQLPIERVASTEAAIRAAREVGAPEHPQPALYLRLAQEQFDKAKGMMERHEDAKRVELLLRRAESDAELAVALSKEETTRSEANRLNEQLSSLRKRAQ
jgi:hypothetical protein